MKSLHSIDPDFLVFFYFFKKIVRTLFISLYSSSVLNIPTINRRKKNKLRNFIAAAPYTMQYQRQRLIFPTEHYFFLRDKSQSLLSLCFCNHLPVVLEMTTFFCKLIYKYISLKYFYFTRNFTL